MKIALFTTDRIDFPSTQIRIIEPVTATGTATGNTARRLELINGMGMIERNLHFGEIDLLLIQRAFPRPHLLPLCESLVRSGKPIVYETDDLLQAVPEHHKKADYNPELARNINWLAGQADIVTVSTPALAQFYREYAAEVVVLPNYLSTRLWHPALNKPERIAGRDQRIRIGLVGSKNHDRDFALLNDLLVETLARYPQVECVHYGVKPTYSRLNERVQYVPPNYLYAEHPQRLAGLDLDIALVPLEASDFNRTKSNIKFLEFGFLGIPGLYANLEPYQDSITHGIDSLLCDTDLDSWRDALNMLIENPALRAQMGQQAMLTVRSQHLLPMHAQRWVSTYQQAIAARQLRSPSHALQAHLSPTTFATVSASSC